MTQPTESASLITQPLFQTKLLLCAAPDYLAKFGTPQTPADLQQHHCLIYGHSLMGNQWQLLSSAGEKIVSVSGTFCSNNGETLAIAAVAGLGIALLPQFIIEPYLTAAKVQIILPDFCLKALNVCILYPANRHLSTKVKLFTEFLKTHCPATPKNFPAIALFWSSL